MDTTTRLIDELRRLGPDAIRARLDALDREARALRTLLRASHRLGREAAQERREVRHG